MINRSCSIEYQTGIHTTNGRISSPRPELIGFLLAKTAKTGS